VVFHRRLNQPATLEAGGELVQTDRDAPLFCHGLAMSAHPRRGGTAGPLQGPPAPKPLPDASTLFRRCRSVPAEPSPSYVTLISRPQILGKSPKQLRGDRPRARADCSHHVGVSAVPSHDITARDAQKLASQARSELLEHSHHAEQTAEPRGCCRLSTADDALACGAKDDGCRRRPPFWCVAWHVV
jgi:hypothetical protein